MTTLNRRPAIAPPLVWLGVAVLVLGILFTFFGSWSLSPKADLIIINGGEPQSLDPAIVTGQLEGRLCLALFEGLATRNAKGDIIPGMAESWVISPDQKTYTFKLRPGIKWSNGEPITSADFLNSWERALSPKTASQYAGQFDPIVNAKAYRTGKIEDFTQVGVKAPDAQTLVVTLDNPTIFFLELTAFQTLAPVHLETVKKYGYSWVKPGHIVTNGPYALKEWRLDDYILLEANPYYWRPLAVKTIKVLPTVDPNTCFNLFFSKKADLIIDKSSIPPTLVAHIRDEPYFHANPFGATCYMRYNVKRAPFNDVRVRQALALAIDKKDIVEKITRAGEPVANTLVPPGNPDYKSPKGLAYNPDEARRLLAEAGYPGGKNFPSVDLLYTTKGSAEQVTMEIQALWKRELGITSIRLRGQEWKVYLNTQSLMDFDLSLSSWVGDYNDPQTFIDMFVTEGGNNLTGWSNTQYDQMLLDSQATPEVAKRMAIFQNMEKILVEDEAPIIPLYFYVGMSLYYPDKLGGFEPNFVDDHRWGEFYIPGKKK